MQGIARTWYRGICNEYSLEEKFLQRDACDSLELIVEMFRLERKFDEFSAWDCSSPGNISVVLVEDNFI